MSKKVFVFDAYGTLLNLDSVIEPHVALLGKDASGFKKLWRTKQLEYSWLLSLMNTYEDFWEITRKALDYTCESFGVEDTALKEKLLSSYRAVKFYDDAVHALRALISKGARAFILTNAPRVMIEGGAQRLGRGRIY